MQMTGRGEEEEKKGKWPDFPAACLMDRMEGDLPPPLSTSSTVPSLPAKILPNVVAFLDYESL